MLENATVTERKENSETLKLREEILFSIVLPDGRHVVQRQKLTLPTHERSQGATRSETANTRNYLISPLSVDNSAGQLGDFKYIAPNYISESFLPLLNSINGEPVSANDVQYEYIRAIPVDSETLSYTRLFHQDTTANDGTMFRVFRLNLSPSALTKLERLISDPNSPITAVDPSELHKTHEKFISSEAGVKKNRQGEIVAFKRRWFGFGEIVKPDDSESANPTPTETYFFDPTCNLINVEHINLPQDLLKDELGVAKKTIFALARKTVGSIETLENSDERLTLKDIDELKKLVKDKELVEELEFAFLASRLAVLSIQQLAGSVAEGTLTQAAFISPTQNAELKTALDIAGLLGLLVTSETGQVARNYGGKTLQSTLQKVLVQLKRDYAAEIKSLKLPDLTDPDMNIAAKIGEASKILPMIEEIGPSTLVNTSVLLANQRYAEAAIFSGLMMMTQFMARGNKERQNPSTTKEKVLKWGLRFGSRLMYSGLKMSDIFVAKFLPQLAEMWIPLVSFWGSHLSPYLLDTQDIVEGKKAITEVRKLLHTLNTYRMSLATEQQYTEFCAETLARYRDRKFTTEEIQPPIPPIIKPENWGDSPTLDQTVSHVGQKRSSPAHTIFDRRRTKFYDAVEVANPEGKPTESGYPIEKILLPIFIGEEDKPSERLLLLDEVFGRAELVAGQNPNAIEGIVFLDFTAGPMNDIKMENNSAVMTVGTVWEMNGLGGYTAKALADVVSHPQGVTLIRFASKDVVVQENGERDHLGYFNCANIPIEQTLFADETNDEALTSYLQQTGMFKDEEIKYFLTQKNSDQSLIGGMRSLRARLRIAEAARTNHPILILEKPFRDLGKSKENIETIQAVADFLRMIGQEKIVIFDEDRSSVGHRIHLDRLLEHNSLGSYMIQNRQMKPESVPVRQLKEELEQFGLPLEDWGKNGYRSVARLAEEIALGEAELEVRNGEVIRKINVAHVRVFYESSGGNLYELIEDRIETETKDKKKYRERRVNGKKIRGVAKKMRPGETPEQTATRGIEQELKIDPRDANGQSRLITLNNGVPVIRNDESTSYLGLKTEYTEHKFGIVLSEEEYEQYYVHQIASELLEDSVSSQVWKWQRSTEFEPDELAGLEDDQS